MIKLRTLSSALAVILVGTSAWSGETPEKKLPVKRRSSALNESAEIPESYKRVRRESLKLPRIDTEAHKRTRSEVESEHQSIITSTKASSLFRGSAQFQREKFLPRIPQGPDRFIPRRDPFLSEFRYSMNPISKVNPQQWNYASALSMALTGQSLSQHQRGSILEFRSSPQHFLPKDVGTAIEGSKRNFLVDPVYDPKQEYKAELEAILDLPEISARNKKWVSFYGERLAFGTPREIYLSVWSEELPRKPLIHHTITLAQDETLIFLEHLDENHLVIGSNKHEVKTDFERTIETNLTCLKNFDLRINEVVTEKCNPLKYPITTATRLDEGVLVYGFSDGDIVAGSKDTIIGVLRKKERRERAKIFPQYPAILKIEGSKDLFLAQTESAINFYSLQIAFDPKLPLASIRPELPREVCEHPRIGDVSFLNSTRGMLAYSEVGVFESRLRVVEVAGALPFPMQAYVDETKKGLFSEKTLEAEPEFRAKAFQRALCIRPLFRSEIFEGTFNAISWDRDKEVLMTGLSVVEGSLYHFWSIKQAKVVRENLTTEEVKITPFLNIKAIQWNPFSILMSKAEGSNDTNFFVLSSDEAFTILRLLRQKPAQKVPQPRSFLKLQHLR